MSVMVKSLIVDIEKPRSWLKRLSLVCLPVLENPSAPSRAKEAAECPSLFTYRHPPKVKISGIDMGLKLPDASERELLL